MVEMIASRKVFIAFLTFPEYLLKKSLVITMIVKDSLMSPLLEPLCSHPGKESIKVIPVHAALFDLFPIGGHPETAIRAVLDLETIHGAFCHLSLIRSRSQNRTE